MKTWDEFTREEWMAACREACAATRRPQPEKEGPVDPGTPATPGAASPDPS